MSNRNLLIVPGIVLAVIAIFSLRPVPVLTEEDALTATGIVAQISEGPSFDVIIHLQDDKNSYYINRGLEEGLILDDLKERLTGNEVTLKYPDYWTPLDWKNKYRHISKMEIEGEIIFNEYLD